MIYVPICHPFLVCTKIDCRDKSWKWVLKPMLCSVQPRLYSIPIFAYCAVAYCIFFANRT